MFEFINRNKALATISQVTPLIQTDWMRDGKVQSEVDMIHRTIRTSSAVMSVSLPTSVVTSHFRALHSDHQADVDALKVVVKFQRKYINYQATYNAFLLGTLSEEEFESEAEAFVSEERSIAAEKLAPMIARLDKLLDYYLTDREIGEYLEVDRPSLQGALAYLKQLAKSESGAQARVPHIQQQLSL